MRTITAHETKFTVHIHNDAPSGAVYVGVSIAHRRQDVQTEYCASIGRLTQVGAGQVAVYASITAHDSFRVDGDGSLAILTVLVAVFTQGWIENRTAASVDRRNRCYSLSHGCCAGGRCGFGYRSNCRSGHYLGECSCRCD